MTPNAKDTAEDIFVKMLETIPDDIVQDKETACKLAKLHADICTGEILNELFNGRERATESNNQRIKFYKEVKSEIEKL